MYNLFLIKTFFCIIFDSYLTENICKITESLNVYFLTSDLAVDIVQFVLIHHCIQYYGHLFVYFQRKEYTMLHEIRNFCSFASTNVH